MTCQQQPPKGPATSANMMSELWEKAADHLTPDELKWFARADEEAILQLANLHDTTVGLACLIASDTPKEGHVVSGNFQDTREVSTLLFAIAQGIDSARGLLEVAGCAASRLEHPELYRVKG